MDSTMKNLTACLFLIPALALVGCQSTPSTNTALDGPGLDDLAFSSGVIALEAEQRLLAEQETRNRATEQALATLMTINKERAPLGEVLDQVRAIPGVNIDINWLALELVGIDRDILISLQLTDVPAALVLDRALVQASGDAFEEDKAEYTIRNGIVVVNTSLEMGKQYIRRVYDVTWFLYRQETMQFLLYHNHPRADELRAVILQNYGMLIPPDEGGIFADGQAGGGLFGVDDTEDDVQRRSRYRLAALADLIESSTGDPYEWINGTSNYSSIDGFLIIKTTPEAHEEIASLLTVLREAQTRQFQEQARLIEVFVLLEQAEAYRLEQDYGRALTKIDQALRVDPASPEATALREIVVGAMSR